MHAVWADKRTIYISAFFFVQNVLHDFLGQYVCVYIDDILIYSRTAEEHVTHVHNVLNALKPNKLLAKPTKCEWFVTSVEYLGHIISGDGVTVDQSKVPATDVMLRRGVPFSGFLVSV
jgi:hypothetical protein